MAGPEGLEKATIQVPFAGGLDLRAHPHLVEAPRLLRALDVEPDGVGGLRLRKPYADGGAVLLEGGALADVRKAYAYGDELLVFTKDALRSWSSTLSKWANRGTHLAVKVEETTRFANPNDQVFADRAQFGGLIVYVWSEVDAGGATRSCYLAAIDATTKATVIAPTSFGAGCDRPRVVATDSNILVFWVDAGGVKAAAINTASPSFTTSGATSVSSKDAHYDVLQDPTDDDTAVLVVRNGTATAYDLARVTDALGVTTSTKTRTCNGVIALACSPSGVLLVARQAGASADEIRGDLVTASTLVDTGSVDVAIGSAGTSTINHLTAAFQSVTTGGQYRAYVFWSIDEATDIGTTPAFELKSNWINTAGATGSEGVFLLRQGIVARAFDHGGSVYLWTAFAGESYAPSGTLLSIQAQYQNSYFLHRDDGELVTKAAWHRAAGFGYYGAAGLARGHLPGVALVSGTTGYAWCGIERRLVTTLNKVGRTYAARAPRDVVFTFDSDDARRVAQLGRTLYITGGMPMMYDGESIVEVGFQVYPWMTAASAAGGGGAAVPAGKYSLQATRRWDNAAGEVERSTTATKVQVTLAGTDRIDLEVDTLQVTRKQGSRRAPALEGWRTRVNPASTDAPYYLVTGKDPAVTAGDNSYLENGPAIGALSVPDNLTDAQLLTKEQHPENGRRVPRFAPPGATIILASDTRLFLAGVPGEPTRVWYSLLRNEGELAAFNSLLSFELPAGAGAITALALWQETLVVFTASAVYAVPGEGYSNLLGTGLNYGPTRLVSVDVGALSHDTVALTSGGVVFFSRKGWYRLNGGWGLDYIGERVEEYNSDTWVAAQVVESQHQVRVLSTSRMLVWDYSVGEAGEWFEWSQTGGRGLAMWRGTPVLVDSAVKTQQSAFTSAIYKIDVEMQFHFSGPQGFARVKRILALGEYKAQHELRIRVGRDYQGSYDDDRQKLFAGLTVGNPVQLEHRPSQPRASSFRVRVTVENAPGVDAITLTSLALEVGLKPGLSKRLPATQKQ
jgi:hypothetical protein